MIRVGNYKGKPRGAWNKNVNVIPHEDRDCPIHGRGVHAFEIGGRSGTRTWRCMECRRSGRGTSHGMRTYTRTPDPATRPACPACFLELPVSGVCGTCD